MSQTVEADFLEAGRGHSIVLVHSSVAGARQWRSLMEALSDEFHLIAINLFGYGKTAPWPEGAIQTLEDHVRLIEPLLPADGGKFSLVGHSFGASVAMKAAALFGDRVHRLVLIEPNPFYLLKQHGREGAFQEALVLRDLIKASHDETTWLRAAEVFSNYWNGAGSWHAMPADRRSKFANALRPNFHEWDAVMNEPTSLSDWARLLPKETTVISAADTVRSIDEIVSLMQDQVTDWCFETIETGGHMAPMTRPDLVNPIIERALR